jgi:rfaE bifunctional protein kinase chain/domain
LPSSLPPRHRRRKSSAPPSSAGPGLAPLVRELRGRRILVIADLVADEFVITGEPRVSREAPVLILRHVETRVLPGGGANAAANVAALGGVPVILGEVGDDELGSQLVAQLAARGADVDRITRRPGLATPRKTRFLAGDRNVALQQVVRVDRIEMPRRSPSEMRRTRQAVQDALSNVDGVLVSDYGLGFVTPELVAPACGRDTMIALDSRHRLLDHRDVSVATPSEQELEAALGTTFPGPAELERGGREVLSHLRSRALLLTRGSLGMLLFEPGRRTVRIPAFGTGTVADVTGAGDTVIATLALALAAGASHEDAARLANAAAGIKVTKMGTATVSAAELSAALENGDT